MGKRISWAEPLITLEVPNSWPAIRQVPISKYELNLQEGGNSLNTPFILKNKLDIKDSRCRIWCRYVFIIIIIVIISLIVYYKYYK